MVAQGIPHSSAAPDQIASLLSGRAALVTGGAGFVGSSLAFAIKEAAPDADVVALDSLMRRGSELNVPD